jgi:tetratricopeptide (TPR) repeat protein
MPFFVLIFLLFLGWVGYLAQINPGGIAFFISGDRAFDLSIATLILMSAAFGGALVLLALGVSETKAFFARWKAGRKARRDVKVSAHYDEAVRASLSLRYRDATALLQKVLAIDPQHIPALLRLGKIYRKEKNYPEAIRLHKVARGIDEGNIETLLALAKDMEASGREEEAERYLKEIIAVDRQNYIGRVRLRDLYLRSKQWDEAHTVQMQIVDLPLPDDRHAEERATLLGLKYEAGSACLDDHDRARRYFKDAVKLDKGFLPPYMGLAELYVRRKRPDKAARLLERGYGVTQRIALLHRLEDLYIELGTPERMLKVYRRTLERNPDDPLLKFYLGHLYYRLEMIDAAYDLLLEVDLTVDTFPDLHKILGNIHLRRGNPVGAVEAFKKSLHLKEHIDIPYHCTGCGNQTTHWLGRCPGCHRWDSHRAHPVFTEKSASDRALAIPY